MDLRDLHFADASLMVDLAMLARRLRRHGRVVRVRGAAPQIDRLMRLTGVDRVSGVSIERPPVAA